MKLIRTLSALVTIWLLASCIQSRASQAIHHQGWIEYTEYQLDFTGPAFSPGDSTPLSETVGDLEVNYWGLGGTFTLVDASSISSHPTPTPVLAGEPDAHWLSVSFSEKMFGIRIDYVVPNGFGPVSIQLFDQGIPVGPVINGSGDYPEGFVSLLPVCICPNFFDSVLISDEADPSFAIRRIAVYHSATPDCSSTLSFLAIGLFGVVALKAMRKEVC